MTLKERLKKILKSAGVEENDQKIWIEKMDALPFDKAEVFVYILGQMKRDDIVFFNKNLKNKIDVFSKKDESLFYEILKDEENYLSQ